MSKEVSKKEQQEVVVYSQEFFDDLPSADASDYRIPNLVICQPTSKLTAAAGEVVDLNTKQVVCGAGKPLNFVPLWFFKTWEIFHEDKGGNREYQGKELVTPKNALWKWEEQAGDVTIRRTMNINVFMILEKDLGSSMPQLYMFKFRGKSSVEGKKLVTFWTNAKNYRQLPFSYVFSITPTLVTDQKGKYYVASLANVLDDGKYRQIGGSELKVAHGWVEMIKTNLANMTSAQLKVDDHEAEGAVDVGPVPMAPAQEQSAQLSF